MTTDIVTRSTTFAASVVVFAVAAVISTFLPSYYAGLMIDGVIFSILALSLNLLLGYTGLPSLGHAAYFGVGAYVAGLFAIHVGDNFWLSALAAVALSMAVGAIFGAVALQTVGVYFLMITLALGQITWAIAFSWRSLTGGDDGLRGITRPSLGLPGISLADTNTYLIFVIVAAAVALLLMHAIVRSSFGHALRGIQQNPQRMAALGYRVWLHKYLAFILASGFAGFAGVLFAYYKGFMSPESIGVVVSAEITLMVIVGGAGTLLGPFVGAFLIVFLSHGVSSFTNRWSMILGLLYITVVLLAPNGLVALFRERLRGDKKS